MVWQIIIKKGPYHTNSNGKGYWMPDQKGHSHSFWCNNKPLINSKLFNNLIPCIENTSKVVKACLIVVLTFTYNTSNLWTVINLPAAVCWSNMWCIPANA